MSEINFIEHGDIDFRRWDALMEGAVNSSVYGYSWYLDAITGGHWHALVYGDYQAVFPLPVRNKFGLIPYVYQPFFCQQLGLFAKADFEADQRIFIDAIPKKYKRIHLQLNARFPLNTTHKNRPNYTLPLVADYESLKNHFKEDALKNLKKSEKKDITYRENVPADLVLDLHKNTWGALNPGVKAADYSRFIQACEAAEKSGKYYSIAAYENDQLLGGAIFMLSSVYLHYLVSGPTAAGRKLSIMHGIMDHAIRKYAGSGLTLDFEGSRIPEVAKFYEKWGSERHEYFEILLNRPLF